MTNTSQKFWPFSLAIYGNGEVAQACLVLQNTYGLDVNLVLFCCWYGSTRGQLPSNLLEAAQLHSETWRENVVQPLRDVRTWMKKSGAGAIEVELEFEALRQEIKAIELKAEKMQQQSLQRLVGDKLGGDKSEERSAHESSAAILDNLHSLVKKKGLKQSAELITLFEVLTKASTSEKN